MTPTMCLSLPSGSLTVVDCTWEQLKPVRLTLAELLPLQLGSMMDDLLVMCPEIYKVTLFSCFGAGVLLCVYAVSVFFFFNIFQINIYAFCSHFTVNHILSVIFAVDICKAWRV